MRSRVLASVILLFFVGIPLILYWYFYREKISGIVFVSESDIPYDVQLEGKLEYTYFPLFDKAFLYRSICSRSCIFEPVPPLVYDVTITASGREDIHDRISLTTGERYRYDVHLPIRFVLLPSGKLPIDSEESIPSGYDRI
jgi:hypothetical protein